MFPTWRHLTITFLFLAAMPALGQQQPDTAYPAWGKQSLPLAPVPYEKFSPSIATTDADFQNSVVAGAANNSVLQLSLSDAIARGISQNLGLRLNLEAQTVAAGRRQQSLQALWPVITASGATSWNVVDLQAEGFRGGLLSGIPGLGNVTIPAFVKYAATDGQLNLNWTLLSLPSWEQYKQNKVSEIAAADTSTDSRETVVLNVAEAYLLVLADATAVDNAVALLKADQAQLRNVQLEHEAGIAPHLDELRAQVQTAQQQQQVISAQRDFEKQKNTLKRLIGVPVQQEINLTETVPFSDLDAMAAPELEKIAWSTRADLAGAKQRVHVSELKLKSAKYERLPTLGVGGYYGVIGPTAGPYHGDFVASASLQFPIFQEAKLRGDRDTARAQVQQNQLRVDSLKQDISAEIHRALLDVAAARQQLELARSNVDLVKIELDQSSQRFAAGVQDNLPVVVSQSDVANAQNSLVQSAYQYNVAKLQLARALGLIDKQWRDYLGEK